MFIKLPTVSKRYRKGIEKEKERWRSANEYIYAGISWRFAREMKFDIFIASSKQMHGTPLLAWQTRVAYSNGAKSFPLRRIPSATLPPRSRTRALLPPVVSFRIWVIVIRFSFGARSSAWGGFLNHQIITLVINYNSVGPWTQQSTPLLWSKVKGERERERERETIAH